jgi:tetratricopeptide (TPR) repeat protein
MNSAPSSAVQSPDSRETLYQGLLIILACFFVFAPSLSGEWLWDDDSEVTRHTALRRVGGLWEIWTAQSSVDYLPVKSTFQWVAYRFFGENPAGWRWLNLLLHTGNCFLFWAVLRRLGVRLAWVGGLLFAIHPMVVGSVAWISELKNTLSLPLLLGALWFFLNFFERGRLRDYGWALAFFALSVFAKASGVMFPVFLLLLVWWWKQGGAGYSPGGAAVSGLRWSCSRIVLLVAPFFLVSLLAGLSTIYFQQQRAIGPEALPLGGWDSRLALAGMTTWFYLWQSVFPFSLLPIYPRWEVHSPQWWQFLGWVAWALLFGVAWVFRRTWGRHLLLSLGFFFLNLLPVSGLLRMSYMRITWVSDHLAYLSLLGVIGLLSAGLSWLWFRLREQTRPVVLAGCFALGAILLLRSYYYSPVFVDETALWTYTLRRNPDAWQAHSRLSRRQLEAGNLASAFYHVQEAHRLRPDLPETHNNLASALIRQGKLEEGEKWLQKAVEMAPYSDMFKMNLANLLVRQERHEEAREMYLDLLRRNPTHPQLLTNYGASLFFAGQVVEAMQYFRRALHVEPNLAQARSNLLQAQRFMSNSLPGGLSTPVKPQESEVGFLDAEAPLRLFEP